MQFANLNNKLIDSIKEIIDPNKNISDIFMETLCIERKAAYRRITGEVPLSFQEVATLASKFNISLDKIILNKKDEQAMFSLSISTNNDFIKSYEEKMEHYLSLFQNLHNDPNSSLNVAFNMIPAVFNLKYDTLAKLTLLKWNYRFYPTNNNQSNYNSFDIPQTVRDKQLQFINYSQSIPDTTLIINGLVFINQVNDIKYFHDMGLLSTNDIALIKADLLKLLADLEQIAISGMYPTGNKIHLYISNVSFEASFGYLTTSSMNISTLVVYFINAITTFESHVTETTKEWIESLKLGSVFLTNSGEIHRRKFFMEQHKIINQL